MSTDASGGAAVEGRPRQPRAQRTRAALLRCARAVFEERGFVDARVSEICDRAGVAHGSFYTHFSDKEAVFAELVDTGLGEVLSAIAAEPRRGDAPADRIERANRAYLRAYRRNAALMAVLEQVATISPRMLDTYLRSWGAFYDRLEAAIDQWQRAGLVPGDVLPRYAAVALATLVGRTAYTWMVLGEPYDEDTAVDQLTRLYCRAIGISPPAPPPRASAPTP